jgi:glutamate formiminotransferase / formiminotetrahydrofolate cyclodeaminase
MVANLWQGKMDTQEAETALFQAAEEAQRIKDQLVLAVDEDTNAFNAYMEARRLPSRTPAEKDLREQKMQDGLKTAIAVPYHTAELSYAAIQASWTVARHGNVNSITDAAVGAQMAFSGVQGGVWNVLINLKDITDAAFVREMRARCDTLIVDGQKLLTQVTEYVGERLRELNDPDRLQAKPGTGTK